MTAKNGQLKEEVKKLKKANNSLKRKSNELRVKVAVSRARNAELDSNVKSKLTEEQANTNSVKQENTSLKSEINFLKKTEIKNRDESISALKKENNMLKKKLERLSKHLEDITLTQHKSDLHIDKEKKRMQLK